MRKIPDFPSGILRYNGGCSPIFSFFFLVLPVSPSLFISGTKKQAARKWSAMSAKTAIR